MEEENIVIPQWVYETKCRRCLLIIKHEFGSKLLVNARDFIKCMAEEIKSPNVYICSQCKNQTVQDIVSIGEIEDW